MNVPTKKTVTPSKPIVKPLAKPFNRGNLSMSQKAKMEAMITKKPGGK